MSNVIRMDRVDDVQRAQGEYLWSLLDAERWTYRKLQARTGIKVGVISSRMHGITPLTVGEVVVFAEVLRRDPVALYRELLECAPSDSNREPIVRARGLAGVG